MALYSCYSQDAVIIEISIGSSNTVDALVNRGKYYIRKIQELNSCLVTLPEDRFLFVSDTGVTLQSKVTGVVGGYQRHLYSYSAVTFPQAK